MGRCMIALAVSECPTVTRNASYETGSSTRGAAPEGLPVIVHNAGDTQLTNAPSAELCRTAHEGARGNTSSPTGTSALKTGETTCRLQQAP